MRRSLIEKALLFLMICWFFWTPSLIQVAKSQVSEKVETAAEAKATVKARDAVNADKENFPFEAEEIRISEGEIYVRTKEGKEFLVEPNGDIRIPSLDHRDYILKGDEPFQEIILDDGKITIGGRVIDLRDFWDLEALDELPRIKMPRVRGAPRVHTGEGVFRMGSDVVVEEDESIDGDVVALWGDVVVKGAVSGDVVSVGGDVEVYSTGIVEGSTVSIGGSVTKRAGAVVEGEKVSVGFLRGQPIRLHPLVISPLQFPALGFFARILKILFFIFLGVVVISIVPKHVTNVQVMICQNFLKSGLVGLLTEILVLPIFILLIITIIGIPVAILVEPLLILVALILGYTGICLFIGKKIKEHTSLKPDTRIMTVVIGILAVELVPLIARTIGLFGDVFSPLTWMVMLIGWLIGYVVITVGLGAAVLTRLGTRPKEVTPATVVVSNSQTDSESRISG